MFVFPVVVSLVITLGSPVREVRRAAIACLQRFAKVPGSAFHVVVNSLVNMAEEIIADPTHLSQVRKGALFKIHNFGQLIFFNYICVELCVSRHNDVV